MKTSTLLITIFVGFLISNLNAQETIWFNSDWGISTKEKAVYYRPVPEKKNNGFWIVDYYISGKKQKEGFSTSAIPSREQYNGIVNYFYENGNKFQIINYVKGKPEGNFSKFYSSEELEITGKYTNGLREGIWKTFYNNGKIKERGKYREGEKVGVWKTFFKNDY